ncbi:hypothetical protein TKK_0014755 [Trichogramma kaykai]|uniref:Uncharacterized protein n=1 Tax=Trichogramma kaykai TaxID=54128 RepID=A0ABD2WCG0_9HYME
MNNTTRRLSGPVRQLSLQQPPPPRNQQPIRRQRSTEDEKSLKHSASSKFTNKCDYYTRSQMSLHDRPKIRMAWSDEANRAVVKTKTEVDVEIVARQIPTVKPGRPATSRSMRNMMDRYSLGEKATILYSRQELAERLRLAWRQRQENKSNIDIFLAHNTVEEKCDSAMSTLSNPPPTVESPPTPANIFLANSNQKVKENANDEKVQNVESSSVAAVNDKTMEQDSTNLTCDGFQLWYPPFETKCPKNDVKNNKDESTTKDGDKVIVEKADATSNKTLITINCNVWSSNCNTELSDETKEKVTSSMENDYSRARLRRASFKSGLNKAFVEPVVEKPPTPRLYGRVGINTQEQPKGIRRTNSAPPQKRSQENVMEDTGSEVGSSPTEIRTSAPRRIMSADDHHNHHNHQQTRSLLKTNSNSSSQINVRPIKSAQAIKKRIKFSKKRNSSFKDKKDDGDVSKGKNKSLKVDKNVVLETKCPEVVTMVSLVSSAESESEIDENSPRDNKLISELRNKLSTTPIIKSSNGLNARIRKPFKSVSFQQDSLDCDSPPRLDNARLTSYETHTMRPVTTSCAYSQIMRYSGLESSLGTWHATSSGGGASSECGTGHESSSAKLALTAPLTDREKRCLAVPIGDVFYDKKPKLVRCRSAVAPPRLIDSDKRTDARQALYSQQETRSAMPLTIQHSAGSIQQTNSSVRDESNDKTPGQVSSLDINLEKEKSIVSEPYCQTPKEKECWHLYRKMCDKGVFVSFDTVLRGMLTPTEYRLRQKEVNRNS